MNGHTLEQRAREILHGRLSRRGVTKTVVVAITRRSMDQKFKKIMKHVMKIKAHDEKNECKIGDRVQVGSDTTLVAPIALGDDVYVATATTVRHDVPAGALVFNQREEKIREGWTEQKRKQMKGKDE